MATSAKYKRYDGTTWEDIIFPYSHKHAWSDITSTPTTLSGYGITDAKISNGVITLGGNTITPLTSITSAMVTTALGFTPYNATNPNKYTSNTGTVTKVSMTVPEELVITGSGITTSGTLAITYKEGYAIPSTADQLKWTSAYNWGNHANQGYLKEITESDVSSLGFTKNTGTVTSVKMTVPTGLSVSGSPITTSGTLAISLASGYSIPTTTKQGNWDTAYGWGDHSKAGYKKTDTNTTYEFTSGTNGFGVKDSDGNTYTISVTPSIGTASSTQNGLMTTTYVTRLNTMWNIWSADDENDSLVNKVQEVLTAFENFPEANNLATLLAGKQPLDSDLTAIAGLSDTSKGFLKKTGSGTWELDTNTYLTTSSASSTYVNLTGAQTISGAKTFTANVVTKNNNFEIKANSNTDDSWIKLTNATDSGYYAFGIRRPYATYGLQMKIHGTDGKDTYYNIWHQGNFTPSSYLTKIAASETYLGINGTALLAKGLTSVSIGSGVQPVYFNASGVPVACTYTLNKSVPSDAKFTDTNTTYSLSKDGSSIILTGSDGSTTSVTDSNDTYTLSSFGVSATATELNYVKGVTSSIQTQITDTQGLIQDLDQSLATVAKSGSYNDLSGKPASLKNPNAINLKVNSETSNFISYDGSAAKTITIKPSTTNGAFIISDGTTNKTIQLAGKFTDNNTTYSAGDGISLSGTTFSNSGVRSVTQDSSNGHKLTFNVGGVDNVITIPDSNTDTKVTQTVTSSSNTSKRPILLGMSYSDAATPSFANTTDTCYASHNIYVAPSTGYLYAQKLYSGGQEVLTSHQSLSGLVALTGTQEITGDKTFNAVAIKAGKTLTFSATSNSSSANMKWGTVNSKNPYIGYASDQTDGTFVWSITGTAYATGLAIGGGSGNLLWKGTKVATINDIPSLSGYATESFVSNTYATKESAITGLSVSGTTITYTKGNGTTGTITTTDTNTRRAIQVNGTQILSSTSTTALNLEAGSNVTISNSGGTVTISASSIDIDDITGDDIYCTNVSEYYEGLTIDEAIGGLHNRVLTLENSSGGSGDGGLTSGGTLETATIRDFYSRWINAVDSDGTSPGYVLTSDMVNCVNAYKNGELGGSTSLPTSPSFYTVTTEYLTVNSGASFGSGSNVNFAGGIAINGVDLDRYILDVVACLMEGTLITMADGSSKPIEEVKEGDLLMSYDFETGKKTTTVCLGTRVGDYKPYYYCLMFDNGFRIKTNWTHDIYNATKGTWTNTDVELELDDEILTENNGKAKFIGRLEAIGTPNGRKVLFYDIMTSNNCYYADGVLFSHTPTKQASWINRHEEAPEELINLITSYKNESHRETDLMQKDEYVNQYLDTMHSMLMKESKLRELKDNLSRTDYITLKVSEGIEITDTMQEILDSRKMWRKEFNEVEAELSNVYKTANDLKVKYSDIGEDVLLDSMGLRKKFFLESCKKGNANLNKFKEYYRNSEKYQVDY